MEREESLRKKAKEYAEAQSALEDADRKLSDTTRAAQEARSKRDALTKELKEFVGRNIPRKLVLVGDTKAVLIQLDETRDSTYVSVEAVL